MLLGTKLKAVLEQLGVTEQEVQQWLGSPCGCEERRQALDALHQAAKQGARWVLLVLGLSGPR